MRRREFDVARGLAVVFMIAVHLMSMAYGGGSAAVARAVDFLGSAPAAPVFMFILGANVLSSRHNSPRELFLRGVWLFLGSYLFNAVCHAAPVYVVGRMRPTAGWMYEVSSWCFAVDILTFAGLAFMLIALVRKLKLSPRTFFVIAVVLHAAGTVLNAAAPVRFEDHMWLAGLLSLFYNASAPGYFPLLTWIVYPAAGMLFADLLGRARDEEGLWRRAGGVSALVFAVMLTVFCLMPSVHGPYYKDAYVYYRNGYFPLVHNLSFVVAWLALLHAACRRLPKLGTGLLLDWSRNLTAIYVIQWLLIGYVFVVPFAGQLWLGALSYLAGLVGLIVLCDLVSRGYRLLRGK